MICSIDSLLALWEEWKNEGNQYLMTYRLNQDGLGKYIKLKILYMLILTFNAELFFSCVRQMLGGSTHPSAAAFSLTFR